MTLLSPETAAPMLEKQDVLFLDVREADEYARSHIPGSHLTPLSGLNAEKIPDPSGRKIILLCQSGARSEQARQILALQGIEAQCLQGGLMAWQKQGLPVNENKAAPISVMRQVQIIAGSLILLGVLLGHFFHPGFYILSGFVGAGLLFAGVSGLCMMANLLMLLPYNKIRT